MASRLLQYHSHFMVIPKIVPYLKRMSVKMDLVKFKNRCNGILMRFHKNPLDQ